MNLSSCYLRHKSVNKNRTSSRLSALEQHEWMALNESNCAAAVSELQNTISSENR